MCARIVTEISLSGKAGAPKNDGSESSRRLVPLSHTALCLVNVVPAFPRQFRFVKLETGRNCLTDFVVDRMLDIRHEPLAKGKAWCTMGDSLTLHVRSYDPVMNLSPDLLKAQFVSGRMWARRIWMFWQGKP